MGSDIDRPRTRVVRDVQMLAANRRAIRQGKCRTRIQERRDGCLRPSHAVRTVQLAEAASAQAQDVVAEGGGGELLAIVPDTGQPRDQCVAPRIERWVVRRDEHIPSPAASFFFIWRWPLPGVLVELLENAHHRAGEHHEGCDFHGSPPQLRATLARCES